MLASTSFLQRLGAIGVLVAAGSRIPVDSTRQVYGYGGVLPVPVVVADTEIAMALPELLVARRTLGHGEKGRVLYAASRPSAARTDAARAATPAAHARRPCSQLVQARVNAGAAPIS
ncbi:MAG TPA: hypothetical protein VJU87_03985 [Gemmatimonadaceae bacterium]|nr:hypothetical protein [Gemmatimonadaceae bacterium]